MCRFRKTIAVCLIAVLGIVSFTSCGDEEVKKAEAPKRTPLESSVTMTVADGEAFSTVGKLSGDIKLDKVKDQAEVLKTLKSGKCDFAVLNPIEAARYYNENGGIKVVSTLSLGEWKISINDYEGEPADETDLVKLSGQTFVGINDEAYVEKDDADGSEVEEGSLDAEGNPVVDEGDEAEEPIELKNMAEEVFQTLMAKEGYGFYDGQTEWVNVDDASDYIGETGATVMANEKNMKKATAKKDFTEVYSLSDLWSKDFGNNIPGYVLVATDKFLKDRNYEVEGVLDAIADSLEDNQKGTDIKLVAYNTSNRGVIMVRDFMDNLAEYNSEAIDGEKVSRNFYWSNK